MSNDAGEEVPTLAHPTADSRAPAILLPKRPTEPNNQMNTFTDLRLSKPILRSIKEQGYDTPTPIQIQAIPHLIEGRDLLGIAQTGTGKTAAFALPILDFLASDPQAPAPRQPSVLVLTPTRELATQISESFRVYGRYLKVRHAVVFGGVNQRPQVNALRQGIDVLVATPGRLIDLMEQGHIDLGAVEIFVLDEADRMLDITGVGNNTSPPINPSPTHLQ